MKETVFEKKETVFEKYGLRPYQIASCIELLSKYEDNDNNIPLLLVMPTGTGKTLTAMSLCFELLKSGLCENVVWVAHRYELINQATDTMRLCCYLEIGKTREDYKTDKKNGCLFLDEEKEKKFTFTMSGVFGKKLSDISENTLVVYDEAHHCVSENSTYCLDEVKRSGAKILGLTATPFRTFKGGDLPFVWTFSSRDNNDWDISKRVDYAIVEEINISKAIMSGYLSKFAIYNTYDMYLKDLLNLYDPNTDWSRYYYSMVINTIKDIINEKGSEKDGYPNPRDKNGKILIFCKYRAKEIYDNLIENNISTGLLLSNDCQSTYWVGKEKRQCGERAEIIKLYSEDNGSEKGSLKVLINNSILTEGFDEPKVTDIILLYNTDSRIRMTQIVGRGLRPFGDENRGCAIYDFASADIIYKLYDGKSNTDNVNSQKMLDDILNQQIAVNGNGQIIVNAVSSGDKIKNTFTKSVIYDYVRGSELEKSFDVAGALVVDDIYERIISSHELERIKNGDFPLRLDKQYISMLENMLKKYKELTGVKIEDFVEYLRLNGKYRPYNVDTAKDVVDIRTAIERIIDEVRDYCKGQKTSLKNAIEEILGKEYGPEGYTKLDLDYYSAELLKRDIKLV